MKTNNTKIITTIACALPGLALLTAVLLSLSFREIPPVEYAADTETRVEEYYSQYQVAKVCRCNHEYLHSIYPEIRDVDAVLLTDPELRRFINIAQESQFGNSE